MTRKAYLIILPCLLIGIILMGVIPGPSPDRTLDLGESFRFGPKEGVVAIRGTGWVVDYSGGELLTGWDLHCCFVTVKKDNIAGILAAREFRLAVQPDAVRMMDCQSEGHFNGYSIRAEPSVGLECTFVVERDE